MNLIFLRSNGTVKVVARGISAEDETITKRIKKYVNSINPNYKIYYFRSWKKDEDIYYDAGSHTEFFILTNKNLKDGDLWE